MRRVAFLLAAPLLLSAAPPPRPTLGSALAEAQGEAKAAQARAAKLEQAAAGVSDEQSRLRAQRLAAAAGIDAAEAEIDAATASLARARAALALQQARLAKERAPVAALIAGIVSIGREPPLLALADGGSVEELVRVRALLDTTMPLIQRRSAALAAEVEAGRRLTVAAVSARAALTASRQHLAERQLHFAALERQAGLRGQRFAGAALGEEDRFLAADDQVGLLGDEATNQGAALANARRVAALGLSPARPFAAEAGGVFRGLAYSLPASADVIDGLGSVSPAGVRSRGLRLATPRGAELIAPADGTIAFAGPYREHDGVIIIDHGGGWTSLLLGAATPLARGARVSRGDRLGSALGPVTVELRERGQPRSPALIAGSSQSLSNGARSR